MKRIALTALMLAALPATASAQAVTGDRLLVSYREFEKSVQWEGAMYRVQLGRATECNDYMKAIFDLFWSTENKGDKISLLKTRQRGKEDISYTMGVCAMLVACTLRLSQP